MFNQRALKYLKKDKEKIEKKLEKLQGKIQNNPWEELHENNLKLEELLQEYARDERDIAELVELQDKNKKLRKEIEIYTQNHLKWLDEEIELKLDLDSVTKLINKLKES